MFQSGGGGAKIGKKKGQRQGHPRKKERGEREGGGKGAKLGRGRLVSGSGKGKPHGTIIRGPW